MVLAVCAAAPGGSARADKGPIGHRFEKAADWVKVFEGKKRDAWQMPDEVVTLLGIKSGMVVADLGAGTGYLESRLARAVGSSGKVLALDVEPDMVRHIARRARRAKLTNVEARLVPFDDPKLPPASVDRVLVLDTWHHIPDRKAYARKLAAALRPGGAIYIVDFTMEAKHGPPAEHRIRPEAVIDELRGTGLRGRVVQETLPEQYVVVAMDES